MFSGKKRIANGVSIRQISQKVRFWVILFVAAAAIPAFGQTSLVPGDANGDGIVNLDDFFILRQNYGSYIGQPLTLDLGDDITMQLVKIPAGTFIMGSPETELHREIHEGPQHQVTITQPFYMGIYEVTQEQYEAVMGNNPSVKSSDLNAPVDTVDWNDAMVFCAILSQRTGKTVTLPTEAQWEYACRAGTQTGYYYGEVNYLLVSDYAWFDYNSSDSTHAVGEKIPNPWGLYDMGGNVWEWCKDWWSDSYENAENTDPKGPQTGTFRILRGGGCHSNPRYCRSASRSGTVPYGSFSTNGFRVVVSLDGAD